MSIQPVLLWSDALLWGLLFGVAGAALWARRNPLLRAAWGKVGKNPAAMASATFLVVFLVVGLSDSLHYRERLPDRPGATAAKVAYSVEVLSLLDAALSGLRTRHERTYSEPLATRAYAKEMIELADGRQGREFPRLKYGGAHLADEAEAGADLRDRALAGLVAGLALWAGIVVVVVVMVARAAGIGAAAAWGRIRRRQTGLALDALLLSGGVIIVATSIVVALAGGYHVLGTDKVGQDVLYQVLKSVRTALVIGLVTTLVTLPIGVVLGIAAGYFRGWVDDVIQYLYTTLSSVPGVLLIAAAVLMMQVILDTHPQWFSTSAERADMRLLALCFIMGMTSWTGLARLLRGETLKLAQLDYVQAAVAFGVSPVRILGRHILPNVMHIVIIALVMDFSGLVLTEALLSYIDIGVDPATISFGTMINNARMELGREPLVWWTLAAAFIFMFVLVLAANLFADAVRDAFDPRWVGAEA